MTQALQDRSELETSKEDEVTKRLIKFVIWQVELAKKNPEWDGQLKHMLQLFGAAE